MPSKVKGKGSKSKKPSIPKKGTKQPSAAPAKTPNDAPPQKETVIEKPIAKKKSVVKPSVPASTQPKTSRQKKSRAAPESSETPKEPTIPSRKKKKIDPPSTEIPEPVQAPPTTFALTTHVLSTLKAKVSQSTTLSPPLNVVVHEIRRFMNDQQSMAMTSRFTDEIDAEGYDLVLTDGEYKVKALLWRPLNSLVRQGKLIPGSPLEIHEMQLLFDETILGGPTLLLLKHATFPANFTPASVSIEKTPTWSPEMREDLEQVDRPLIGSRDYYLGLYNDDDVDSTNPRWTPAHPEQPTLDQEMLLKSHLSPSMATLADVPLLKETLTKFSGKKDAPMLIGRITALSHLNHYGKPDDVRDKFPFQCFFTLHDQSMQSDAPTQVTAEKPSAGVQVILWNTKVRDYYPMLRVNMVIALLDYRVQRAFSQSEGLEISINPKNPAGKIIVLQEDPQHEVRYPSLCAKTLFETRCPVVKDDWREITDLHQSKDGDHVGILGRVIACSPVWREKSLRKRPIGGLSQFRYVLVSHLSAVGTVVLKLYGNSQLRLLEALQTGHYLAVTHLKVHSYTVSSRQRSVYLASTFYSRYRSALQLAELSGSLDKKTVALAATFQAPHDVTIPLPSNTFRDYCDMMGGDPEGLLQPTSTLWRTLSGQLQYRECQRVACQGYLTSVRIKKLVDKVERVQGVNDVIAKLFATHHAIECHIADLYQTSQRTVMILPCANYSPMYKSDKGQYHWWRHFKDIFTDSPSFDKDVSPLTLVQQMMTFYQEKKVVLVMEAFRLTGNDDELLFVLRKVFLVPS